MRRICFLSILFVSILCIGATVALAQQSASEKAVWKLEQLRCHDLVAGDAAGLSSLLHPDELGWPAASPLPQHGDYFVREVRNNAAKGIQTTSCVVDPVASQAIQNVVVVHFRLTMVRVGKDGSRTEQHSRLTHTWIRTGNSWQIIGGMGAALTDAK
jgi:hypothetical protein